MEPTDPSLKLGPWEQLVSEASELDSNLHGFVAARSREARDVLIRLVITYGVLAGTIWVLGGVVGQVVAGAVAGHAVAGLLGGQNKLRGVRLGLKVARRSSTTGNAVAALKRLTAILYALQTTRGFVILHSVVAVFSLSG